MVAELIERFAQVGDSDELTVYRSLVTSDRDVIRVCAGEGDDRSVSLSSGIDLINGTRDLLLAVACSLDNPKAAYRADANRKATDLINTVRLGQTDHGSYAITLLTPLVPPPLETLVPGSHELDEPIHRRLTRRLMEALTSTIEATERAIVGDNQALMDAPKYGLSANLCDALARMTEPFRTLDVDVSWARTRPVSNPPPKVRFSHSSTPFLREAARLFRSQVPQPDVQLIGFIGQLKRGKNGDDGTVRLSTRSIGNRQNPVSVTVVLEREDYENAVQAHRDRAPVVMSGDLERFGERWRLLNPVLREIIRYDENG